MKCFKGLLIVFLFLFFCSCRNSDPVYPYEHIKIEDFDSLRIKDYVISPRSVKWYIDSLRQSSRDTAYVDFYVDDYYANGNPYLWIDLRGSDYRIDTLVGHLANIESEAIDSRVVFAIKLRKSLADLRNLDFSQGNNINKSLAVLEYYSTKALLRYVCGMRFGFVNPKKFMNRLELTNPEDSMCKTFQVLYDVNSLTYSKGFLDSLLLNVSNGTFAKEMQKVSRESENYIRLKEEYNNNKSLTEDQRRKLIVNMERLRWKSKPMSGKYVWVNVPEFILRAVDEENGEGLEMKVCVGGLKHKTPLFYSEIQRLELNPSWIVPQSIVKKEIAVKHTGDLDYFERNKMTIIEKSTKKHISPELMTAEMFESGHYNVIQESGERNSLGRMIFRVRNNFSIYLHDTPNRTAFNSSRRTFSHGCIRVEKPYELAVFLLEDKDSLIVDKIRIAIDLPPITQKGKKLLEDVDRKRMGLKTYKPAVPFFMTYLTAYPDKNNKIVYSSDAYKYDEKMYELLDSYW